jgi:uncharacterized protein YjbJ (UPF0337 family)
MVFNHCQHLIGEVEETVGTVIADDGMRAEGKMEQRKIADNGDGEKLKGAASRLK